MKVTIPIMIQDPATAAYKGMATEENVRVEADFFIDGPVTKKVALIDFDPSTGQIAPPARFVAPDVGRRIGHYDWQDREGFQQVSVFGTVMKTIAMFERADTLGREVEWAFPGDQLLVVPRAGEWPNAFYERESRSLQFFSFERDGRDVHTSLSRDIVTHETGHAVLDGVVPDLYDAITPQSLALHEAIADLTAVTMAFESSKLREVVLAQTGGSIAESTAFNAIAEEFGTALYGGRPLRNLNNNSGIEAGPGIEVVPRDEPHALSQVLSGALYAAMLELHENLTAEFAEELEPLAAAGRALGIGSLRFARLIFRALDYLVPGEVSFADYGRAILAADLAAHPETSAERERIVDEFVRRGIVGNRSRLEVEVNQKEPQLDRIDRRRLLQSDWAAHEFVRAHRGLFGVPEGVPFELRPRLDATKTYYHRDGEREVRELIFKVSWEQSEDSGLGSRFPRQRDLTVGSTIAIDWEEPVLRARMVNQLTDEMREDRDRFVRRLYDDEVLIPGPVFGPELGKGLPKQRAVVEAEAFGDRMRVRGAAAALHFAGPSAPDVAGRR